MRVYVEDTCTACGLCCDTCPEVFEMGSNMAECANDEVPADCEKIVEQAAEDCPVGALRLE